MKKLALVIGLGISGSAAAGMFGPSNYDECVLKHLQGVSSDVGARMVAASCAKQFPPKKVAERPAPPADPSGRRISGRCRRARPPATSSS